MPLILGGIPYKIFSNDMKSLGFQNVDSTKGECKKVFFS